MKIAPVIDLSDKLIDKKRLIVVGDIHGTFDEFINLLAKINFSFNTDLLISVGDLIDRGPYSFKCLKWFDQSYEDSVYAVLGNHEEKFLRWTKHEAKVSAHYKNPMKISGHRLEEYKTYTPDLIKFIEELPCYIILTTPLGRKLVITHAGLLPGYGLYQQPYKTCIRVRKVKESLRDIVPLNDEHKYPGRKNWGHYYNGEYGFVIHGHNALSNEGFFPESYSHSVNIDTSCCYGGKLTCYIEDLEDGYMDYQSIPAARVYYDRNKDRE